LLLCLASAALLQRWVAFSPDSNLMASAGPDPNLCRDVIFFDPMTFPQRFETVRRCFPSIRIWNTRSGEPVRTIELEGDQVRSAAFSPDGKTMAAVDAGIQIFAVETGERLRTLKSKTSQGFAGISFSADGKTMATVTINGAVELWDAPSGDFIRTLADRGPRHRTWASFSPDGKHIL